MTDRIIELYLKYNSSCIKNGSCISYETIEPEGQISISAVYSNPAFIVEKLTEEEAQDAFDSLCDEDREEYQGGDVRRFLIKYFDDAIEVMHNREMEI